ncbi:hypothetical protein [Campylobacter mucosalis]|uniref:Uncharacterized protein n=1 Tax=Campylobacter mucosalis CCUG 21559 TaxID=1032067 RepID=A0A6G5QFK8_9BACT|nr:hypothetical protein [Campylobacter mucosalis]QCD44460.1 hypothetical protein CMUC_0661 [Campylobacter mucosalis CCUG 21559]
MKFAHYDETTKELLGYYDDKIHITIPIPNIKLTDEQWSKALSINATHINPKTKELYKLEPKIDEKTKELNEALAYEAELKESIKNAMIIGNDEVTAELRSEYKELLAHINTLKKEA